MITIYNDILNSISKGEKLLAVLVDPDKMMPNDVLDFVNDLKDSLATHIFVGGSTVEADATEALVEKVKAHTNLPVVLFPGDITQITNAADGLLFLSLISGRHPDYLIGKHIEAVPQLRDSNLEVIPTGYILVEGGNETAVQRVTGTTPMPEDHIQDIMNTAKAGELLGMKFVYLEAGSGAHFPVSTTIISAVKQDIDIPLIVGGGIRSKEQLQRAYEAGADLVVMGTAIENDTTFLRQL